jgi:hypothetical protein
MEAPGPFPSMGEDGGEYLRLPPLPVGLVQGSRRLDFRWGLYPALATLAQPLAALRCSRPI